MVDLNADLGEGAATDGEMLELVTSASIACGGHAGDVATMTEVAQVAASLGVVVGAHPSYPDRAGFGRRAMDLPAAELAASLRSQVQTLARLAPVRFVKAHGALYNRAAADPTTADVVAAVAGELGLAILCPAGSEAAAAATRMGVTWWAEGFADRAYLASGRLAPRSQPGALIDDPLEVAERAVGLAVGGQVRAVEGSLIEVRADSICLHGDTPRALQLARAVRAALAEAGVAVRAFA